MDPLDVLPLELALKILGLLDTFTLGTALQVSALWQEIVNSNDLLWAPLCKYHCHSKYIERDRAAGFTWKETLIRNYGSKKLLQDWLSGNIDKQCKCSQKLPPIGRFDAEDWGRILDAECARDLAK